MIAKTRDRPRAVLPQALKEFGYKLEQVADAEQNAALGNGGLGRLAACFIDSMATLDYPGWGYGIRYKYGMFRQARPLRGQGHKTPASHALTGFQSTARRCPTRARCIPMTGFDCDVANLPDGRLGPVPDCAQGIKDGFQVELPDIWLTNGNPWELKRPGIKYPVGFYGSVVGGKWQPEEKARCRTACCDACVTNGEILMLPPHLRILTRVSLFCSDLLHCGPQRASAPLMTTCRVGFSVRSWGPCGHLASIVAQVYAQAYDNPIPGYNTKTVGNLRLFEALPETEFELHYFNEGDFPKVWKAPAAHFRGTSTALGVHEPG